LFYQTNIKKLFILFIISQNLIFIFFIKITLLWLLKQNFAHSASGKYIQEKVLDTLLKMVDHSYIFLKDQEISVFGTYFIDLVNLKLKDLDGLQLGEDYIRKSKYLMPVKLKEQKPSKSKEQLKVSLLMQSKK
jgi:hypothetical protein